MDICITISIVCFMSGMALPFGVSKNILLGVSIFFLWWAVCQKINNRGKI